MIKFNKDAFFEYLKTFFSTVFFVFVAVTILFFVIQHQVYEAQTNKQSQDEKIDKYLVNVLIDKNIYLEKKYPDNYKINLKLGTLYELKKDFKNAEKEYKKADLKAPYNEYIPEYKLALLYAEMNSLEKAQAVMDKIQEQPNKKLILYKADVYIKIGDKYYNSGDYISAINKYEKALYYLTIIKKKNDIIYVNNSLASAYVYLAETYLDNMKPDEAINCLKNALLIVNAPIIKYKLAILLEDEDPKLSYKYFDDVFQKSPEIINYEEYLGFLSVLSESAAIEGNIAQANLYEYKIKNVKEYFKNNILSINDIVLEDFNGTIKTNWFQKSIIKLEVRFKNISKYDINSLYLKIVFKDDNQTIDEYEQLIVDPTSMLPPNAYTPFISIKTKDSQPKKDNQPKKIIAEIYVSKTAESYKLHLKTIEIKEEIKEKHSLNFFQKFVRKLLINPISALKCNT
ncbi:MAG: hypothetical protein PHC64_02310 [Candidatus Gastranaerophilales bacterium]|nr:hypothetical protein [Candidatus Gastranaerophilales bacterium]